MAPNNLFVSADLTALADADCAGVQGHCALFGCVRCYPQRPRLCYVGHNRFFLEGDARHNDSLVRPRERSLALAQVDLSIQTPNRGTMCISPLLRVTPRQSFRDFAFDGMHCDLCGSGRASGRQRSRPMQEGPRTQNK